ncbi:MAG: VOC family protein [Thermoanaerobaculia bacterium]|nr:VOC family protein [Thermoanaerobaculia bacterium]
MKLERLTPMLRTWNLPGAVTFYTERLGFRCAASSEEWGWAALERDGVTLMLSTPNEHEGDAAPAFTGSLYFRVDDVEAWWSALRDAAPVAYPLEAFDYGMREFAIRESDGYLLQFGEEIDVET